MFSSVGPMDSSEFFSFASCPLSHNYPSRMVHQVPERDRRDEVHRHGDGEKITRHRMLRCTVSITRWPRKLSTAHKMGASLGVIRRQRA